MNAGLESLVDGEIIDITPTVTGALALFPGETQYRRRVQCSLEEGDAITLSELTLSAHAGAHTDAPSHYALGDRSIDQQPLAAYFGPCEVWRVSVAPGQRIEIAHLPRAIESIGTARVLFATDSYRAHEPWTGDFAALSAPLVDALGARGVVLVGIDTPSIDLATDKEMQSHRAVARANMSILEGVDLRGVDEGRYWLSALPLKLQGADASPVRAVLAPMGPF